MANPVLRPFRTGDAEQVARLFHDTIRTVNIRDYSREQVAAWAPEDIHFIDWANRCTDRYTLVADDDGTIAGFAELEEDGHIDCFYCHPDFQRQGVGTLLMRGIMERAREINLKKLYADVSITARPFFARMGFTVTKEQTVQTRGVDFLNYRMERQVSQRG